MTIFDLFSKRQKALRGDVPDVYTYDDLPNALRVQIVHIWSDSIGSEHNYYNFTYGDKVKSAYKFIVDTLCCVRYRMFQLPTAEKYNDRIYLKELANFLLQENDVERQLDIVELSFRYIDRLTREYYLGRNNASEVADNAINELNDRFKEHGIGFQFIEGEIVRGRL